MSSRSDPSLHRHREQRFIEHVQRLLEDDRFRIDTIKGAKAVTTRLREVSRSDNSIDLKRTMSEMGVPDRELQSQLPVGEMLELTLSQKKWIVFKNPVGRLRVITTSPTRALIRGESTEPINSGALNKLLSAQPPSLGGVPMTLFVMSTSGFTIDAHELADRRADRTVILIEPNDAGGWSVYGPTQMKALTDLLDPEGEDEKRQRVHDHVEANTHELAGSGLAADRIAAKLQLLPQLVDGALKAYAKSHPGLQAKRIDGRMVLFRDGATIATASEGGGANMPLMEKIKSLFLRKGEEEKKIAFLSERRTALSQQRDRSYEEMATLEQQEEALKRSFRETGAQITKKRVTTQLLQLRKDLERRQQLMSVLNQQINVVSAHLHNLELVKQGATAKLPDPEEMTADALKAEEMLAELEAVGEVAGATGPSSITGMSAEEQALFAELEAENKAAATVAGESAKPVARPPIKTGASHLPEDRRAEAPAPRRQEPEAG